MKEGTLAPSINDAVAKLDNNEFTELIPVKSGYIILKVLDRRRQGIPTFDEV